MIDRNSQIHSSVAKYYSQKLRDHGATAKGVDWKDQQGQYLRFAQLAKLITDSGISQKPVSIADFGCGYGAFLGYMRRNFPEGTRYEFLGIDLSEDMIEACRTQWSEDTDARFLVGHEPDIETDFAIASGIFNVSLETTEDEWLAYILNTLQTMSRFARKGFAFNCLTSYSDEDKKAKHLYYADPCYFFDYCKRNFSRNVTLLHDYNLYEFTILVRKL
ncbi:methyltransferase domain-containing protein [Sneathiella chungangensis]|uniref:Methyltransferase domain-containing protein n=1 Tax=Sneathiella chungangensis TaxID=1418234 RepID=A0A845MEK3_9PROT|nr:class I SAM-dependent methyltransferase [Sneathiella chungangensis]MZR21736.1 methyltransferase domain-containing protein [Sneathiella chungangensis]